MFHDFFEAIRTGREPAATLARASADGDRRDRYGTAAGTHSLEEV
jgi:hypothetical protein